MKILFFAIVPDRRLAAGLFSSCLVLSCSSGGSGPNPTLSVSPNPNSVLSEFVSFTLPGISSAHVVSSGDGPDLATPSFATRADGSGSIAVLGLREATSYAHVVEGSTTSGTRLTSGAVTVATAALPAELASLTLQITRGTGAPQPGYYLVSGAGNDAFAVDETGAIRWYRAFGATTQEAKMQPDGTFTTFVGGSTGWQAVSGQYDRFTPDGSAIASYAAASPDDTEAGSPVVYTDPHEVLIDKDPSGAEHIHLMAYEMRPSGGAASTAMAWHELVRQSPDGRVEFRWKSWSRFSMTDRIETDIPTDFDHTNAIAIDPSDGNYIVSLRNLDALVKIDSTTGETLWQFGGVQNEFTLVGDPLGGFQAQHSIRVLANGDLLFYDNGLHHSPPESRAVEYKLDTSAETATLVWQFRHSPAIVTQFVGSVERLANANTLVAFSYVGVVDEVDPTGAVVWEGQLLSGTMPKVAYRIRRLPSLYAYAEP